MYFFERHTSAVLDEACSPIWVVGGGRGIRAYTPFALKHTLILNFTAQFIILKSTKTIDLRVLAQNHYKLIDCPKSLCICKKLTSWEVVQLHHV
mmetsp:Transcript_34453/g.41570  ORF Transcript_34453/g.41570 Transcript_34453/m.41570 type:complete len:94 (-) Transcript_34453:150-431(-)